MTVADHVTHFMRFVNFMLMGRTIFSVNTQELTQSELTVVRRRHSCFSSQEIDSLIYLHFSIAKVDQTIFFYLQLSSTVDLH